METARFTNFSTEAFTGYWNGKGKTFKSGDSLLMPSYLAKHFAKHLTNRELLRAGHEKDTSPKIKVKSDGTEYIDNIRFNEMFDKAYTVLEDEDFVAKDDIDVQIEVANKNYQEKQEKKEVSSNVEAPKVNAKVDKKSKGEQDPTEPQVIGSPDDDEDESEFNVS